MADLRRGVVTARVPATSANLGPGFDCLGLCLDIADAVSAEVTAGGTTVEVAGEGAGMLPEDDSHLVVATMRRAFDTWGIAQPGLRVTCRNAIPQGRGLGSSAAAIVAGLLLAGALVPERSLGPADALPLAADLDGHADNVAACLFGGLVVTWSEKGVPRAVRLQLDESVVPVVFCADRPLSTSLARGLLPELVPHAVAAANGAHVALLVVALTQRPDLLLPATVDHLHQEARRSAVPESMRLVDALRARGVAAVVSGAGPSVLALCTAQDAALAETMSPPGWRVLRTGVDQAGASIATGTGRTE